MECGVIREDEQSASPMPEWEERQKLLFRRMKNNPPCFSKGAASENEDVLITL